MCVSRSLLLAAFVFSLAITGCGDRQKDEQKQTEQEKKNISDGMKKYEKKDKK